MSSVTALYPSALIDILSIGLPDCSPVAEVLINDPSIAIGSGYSESKWIAERLITLAAESNVWSPTIVRIGQVSGSENGAWRTSEWLPSMVSASIALGCVPDTSGVSASAPLGNI